MPIARLRTADTLLLVIDVQEKLMPAIADGRRVIANCALMARVCVELGLPFLVTEHYPRGLGRTVPELDEVMFNPAARVEKTRFSALVDLVDQQLRAWRRTNVLLCGVEAHVCVLQTALDLQASGRQAWVVSDAVSASQPDQIGPATRRWEHAGAITTGVMSATYELLGDAEHPARRACVELVKNVR